jgi:hypothetical protein
MTGPGKGRPQMPTAEFIALFEKKGAAAVAKASGIGLRSVFARRQEIELREGITISSPDVRSRRIKVEHAGRHDLSIKDGVVLVGSDSHYWPGIVSTAHRAFVKFCKEMAPVAVIKNGDVLDGATISRHPPIGWESRPSLIQEIEACKERLGEIELAAGKAEKVWPLGNHDARFETRLATVAPEYAKIHGVHLRDHFPLWEPCWSCWINDDVVVKHRFRGGIHAPHNNTLWAGKTILTGHLHSQRVTPLTDYNGHRWGVDCGTLADPNGPQFVDYTEANPKNWRSGFVVLTFENYELRQPELVLVLDNERVDFRGKATVV